MSVEFFHLLLGKKTHFYVDLVDLPLKLKSNHLEMNKKMWGLLLSVVFADMFSMSSSLGSVPQTWSKRKRKQHSNSLTCCIEALILKKWTNS